MRHFDTLRTKGLKLFSGRVAPTLRLLEARFGRRVVFVPHYEFDQLPNKKEAPTIAQIEYIQETFTMGFYK